MNTNISTAIAAIQREVVNDETGAAICCDSGVDESVLVMTRASALQLASYLLREVEAFDLRPGMTRTGDAISEILWSLPSFDQPRVCSTRIVGTRGDLRKSLGRSLASEPEILTALARDPDFQDVEKQSGNGEHAEDGKASPAIS